MSKKNHLLLSTLTPTVTDLRTTGRTYMWQINTTEMNDLTDKLRIQYDILEHNTDSTSRYNADIAQR